jgi:hypothetical protein
MTKKAALHGPAPKAPPTDDQLPRISEEVYRRDTRRILEAAQQGEQVAVVAKDGRILTVIGMNGVRYLPPCEEDPYDLLNG